MLWAFQFLENIPINNQVVPRTLIYCCSGHASKNICQRFKNNQIKKVFCKNTWDLLRDCNNYETYKEILSCFQFLCYNKHFTDDMLKYGIVKVSPINLVRNFETEIYRIHCIQSNIARNISNIPKLENVSNHTNLVPPPLEHVCQTIHPFGLRSEVHFVLDIINNKLTFLPWKVTSSILLSNQNITTDMDLSPQTFHYLWQTYFQYVGFYSKMIHNYNRNQFTNNISENGNMQRRVSAFITHIKT